MLAAILILVTSVTSSAIAGTGNGTGQALSPSLVEYIQSQVDSKQLPGVAIAVLHPDDSVEYGAWGIRTEEGANMTTDVSDILS